jgi:hypothetical protein
MARCSAMSGTDLYRSPPSNTMRPHPERPHLQAPWRADLVAMDALPLLRARLASFGGRVDDASSRSVLATVEGIAIAATVVAWKRPTYLPDRGPHTHGVVRAATTTSTPELVIVRRGFWSRLWSARSTTSSERGTATGRLRAAFSMMPAALPESVLSAEASEALLAIRAVLVRASVRRGVVELEWQTPTFDDHSVLPSAVMVLALALARPLTS